MNELKLCVWHWGFRKKNLVKGSELRGEQFEYRT